MSAPASFSSFPAFDSFPEPTQASSSKPRAKADSKRNHDEGSKKSHKRKKDRRERDERVESHARRDRSRSPSRKSSRADENDERAHEQLHVKGDRRDVELHSRETAAPLYFSDRRGDPLNVQYGRPHSGDVPKYRSIAGGRKVLGLPSAYAVVSRSAHGVEIGIASHRRLPELTDSSTRRRLIAGPSKRLVSAATNPYRYDEVDGFLRLPTSRRKDAQAYRNIEKEDSDSGSSNSEDQFEEESDSDDAVTLPAAQERLRELEKHVKAEPTFTSHWLALLRQSLAASPETTKNAAQSRAEITVAVLGRALSAHPNNARNLVLRLRYLRAGETTWNPDRLLSEWQDALRAVPTPDAIMEWFDWRIRTAKDGAEGIVDDAIKAMSLMRQDEVGMLRVFFRLAIAFQLAGYTERATAMFQAQAELTFSIPLALTGLPLETLLDELERFWDTEVPRLGEEGAQGWAALEPSSQNPIPSWIGASYQANATDPYTRWAESELWSDRTHRLSRRGHEDAEDTDPYATVLLADVRPLLFLLTTPESRDTFRKLWITFYGFHIAGFTASLSQDRIDSADDRWACLQLAKLDHLNKIFPSSDTEISRVTADSHAGVLIGREPSYTGSCLDIPVRGWGVDVFDALSTPSGSTPTGSSQTLQTLAEDESPLLRNILSACRLGVDDEEWDAFSLALEASANIKRAIKLSKSHLAQSQASCARWNAHAHLELLRGKVDDARKVYETVLTDGSDIAKDPAAVHLWWDWAQMEWLSNRTEAAQAIILRSAGVSSLVGTGILRTRRALEDHITQTGSRWKLRVAWVKLRALLELFTSEDPEAMLTIFDTHPAEPRSTEEEHLLVWSCLLLYHYSHTLSQPSRPAILRTRAAHALSLHPNNTILLALVLESERGQAIWGRTRALVGANGEEKSTTRRAAEVWAAGWDRSRWAAEIERTRAALSTAVSTERTRGSFVLWRIYLEFEIRNGEVGRAKKLVYRAIADCPMCKDLYLLAFGPLRKVFTPRELNDFAETMAERGIRMRTGLDEMLVGWTDDRMEMSRDLGEGDYGERDIELEADDRRRLRPY